MSELTLLDYLAESRIEQAIAQGLLDNLPGAGRRSSWPTTGLCPSHCAPPIAS